MPWPPLSAQAGVDALSEQSRDRPQLVFKHSTRCSISHAAKRALDESAQLLSTHATLHYLDLLAFRPISDAIAQQFAVPHESPQVLLIVNGECTREWSHYEIQPDHILAELTRP